MTHTDSGARSRGLRLLAAAFGTIVLPLLLPAATALANWPANGIPASTAVAEESFPASCSDGAGGVVLAWTQHPSGQEQIYVQRLNASGTRLWGAEGIRLAPSPWSQLDLAILALPGGGALLAWSDDRNGDRDIYCLRITASGTVASGWPIGGLRLSVEAKDEVTPKLVTDGSDGALVVWEYKYSVTDWDILCTRVTGAGTIPAPWSLNGARVTAANWMQIQPVACSDQAGGVIVAWQDNHATSGGDYDVWANRITSGGQVAPGWAANGVPLCSAGGNQVNPACVSDQSGGVFVVWDDNRLGEYSTDVYIQRVNAAGVVQGATNGVAVCTASGMQFSPSIACDGAGRIVVAWSDGRDSVAPYVMIWGQRMSLAGVPEWGTNGRALCTGSGLQYWPAIAPDGAGGVVVGWIDWLTSGYTIDAQHVVSDGRPAWPPVGVRVCTGPRYGASPTVIPDGSGGAIFVWADTRGGVLTNAYAWQATGLSDLIATETPAGWSSPAVPRNDQGATPGNCVLPPVLNGNDLTWINRAVRQAGPNPVPAWTARVDLDEEEVPFGDGFFPDGDPPGPRLLQNQWVSGLPGGRHSLTNDVDRENAVPESNESDNIWRGQWVWSPQALSRNAPLWRWSAPPAPGFFAQPNAVGLAFARPSLSVAWLVSEAPRMPSNDYDLRVYDDYTGSTSGFSNLLKSSSQGGNAVDFVVGHYAGTPAKVYPAVTRYFYSPGTNLHFWVDATDAQGRNSSAWSAQWLHQVLGPDRLADVYEGYFQGGLMYYLTLVRESGSSALKFNGYPGTAGAIYSREDASAVSQYVSPAVQELAYSSYETGWHPIVVYRDSGTDADQPVQYSLFWNQGSWVDVPGAGGERFDLGFAGAGPNPMGASGTTLSYSLSRRGPARLEVFDVAGRRVRTLVDSEQDAGPHAVAWDGRSEPGGSLGSGIYWAKLDAEGRTLTRRIAVVR